MSFLKISNNRTPVKDLMAFAIDEKPRDMDWSEGYPERWEYWEAAECDECGKEVTGFHGEARHCDVEDTECNGSLLNEGPMMNYFYPLPEFDLDESEAAKAISDLPLCLVHLEDTDEWGLALTGGGMDLSNEIIIAHMRLGYLPPVHFRPAEYSGQRMTREMRWMIAGMRRSLRFMRQRATYGLTRLKQFETWVKSQNEKRKEAA